MFKPNMREITWEPHLIEASENLDTEVKDALLTGHARAYQRAWNPNETQYIVMDGGKRL